MTFRTFQEHAAHHPHQALDLSDKQRAALPEARWMSYTAPDYNHQRTENVLGEWSTGHQDAPRPDGTFEPVDLKFMLPLPEGMDFKAAMERLKEVGRESEEGRRLGATMSSRELGYVCDQDYARRFVDLARRSSDTRPPEEILLEAGFKEEEPLKSGQEVFRRFTLEVEDKGFFDVVLTDHHLKLTFEEDGKTYWHNLLHLNLGQQSYDGTRWIPTYWSPEVASPLGAAAAMGVEIARKWRPQASHRQKPSGP